MNAPAPGLVVRALSLAMRRPARAVWLFLLAAVAGCQQQIPPDDDATNAARARAYAVAEGAVAAVTAGLPVRGSGRAEGCEPGHDNFVYQDPYEYFCTAGAAVVVGLGSVTGRRAAAERADGLVATACPAADTSFVAQGFAEIPDSVVNGHAISGGLCGDGVYLTAVLVSADADAEFSIGSRPSVAGGFLDRGAELDYRAAIDQAAAAGDDFVLVVSADSEYVRKER